MDPIAPPRCFRGLDTPLYIVGGAVRNPADGSAPISDVDVCGPARPETGAGDVRGHGGAGPAAGRSFRHC